MSQGYLQKLSVFCLFLCNTVLAKDISPSMGGTWFDANQPGHGFVVNISESNGNQVFVTTWYTYDNQRNQMWLLGSTPLLPNTNRLTVQVHETRGALFGSKFHSNDVQEGLWGNLTFEFSSCDTGFVHYTPSVTGYESGTVQISRLTNTAGVACIDEPEPINNCSLSGKVISISDGDTITILDTKNQQTKIRLQGIDAPEPIQPYGKTAKQFLRSHIFNQSVCVNGDKSDRYGRFIGTILLDGENINLKLIQSGYAWHYKQYQNEQTPEDRQSFSEAEVLARSRGIGLWSESDPIPPWDWRKGVRSTTIVQEPATNSYNCGTKKYCTQMHSCSEARYYYRQCGLSRLDSDKDGIPCESLCIKSREIVNLFLNNLSSG